MRCRASANRSIHQSQASAILRTIRILLTRAVLVSVSALPFFAQAANIQYAYDEAGRLIQVVAPDGTSVQYSYDAVGNILANKQNGVAVVSIAEFTPNAGPAGTTVIINGSGFNTTAANNTVKFNGAAATVSSATATSLTVVVPSSATTGTISVTNANGTATSSAPFTVGPSLAAGNSPTAINLAANQSTSFNFAGTAGQGYVLGLTGFSSSPTGGAVNVVIAKPDATTLVTCSVTSDTGCVLPYLPVSGNYTVTLTAGNAAITLSTKLNADLTAALTANIPANFIATAIGQAGTYTFNASAGQIVRLTVTGDDIPGTTAIQLYGPTGTLVQTGTVAASAGSSGSAILTSVNLPLSGIYKVRLVPPVGNGTGRMTVTSLQTVTGTLTVDAAPTSISLLAGQMASYTFNGTAGQSIGLGWTNLATTPANQNLTATIVNPDGSQLGTVSTSAVANGYAIPILPVNGQYTLLLDAALYPASVNIQLNTDVNIGTLAANGAAQVFSPASVGQGVKYGFAGTAGMQNARLIFSGNSLGTFSVFVYQPNGTLLLSTTAYATSSAIDLPTLPVAGTYSVRLMLLQAASGSIAVSYTTPVTGTMVLDAAPVPISVITGQNAVYTFNGTAGQMLGLGLSGISTTPSGGVLYARVYAPGGGTIASFQTSGSAGGYALSALPQTGTYTIVISPGQSAATFNLLLSTDATGTLTPNGAAQTFSPTRVGQAASYAFSGTAAQNLSVGIGGDTFPGSTGFYAYSPNGSLLALTTVNYSSGAAGSGVLTLSNLPVTGTYTLRVMPSGGVGSAQVALKSDAAGTLVVDGTATAVSLTAGQNGRYTFSGTAGQRLGVGLSGIATTPAGGSIAIAVFNPAGNSMGAITTNGTAGGFVVPLLTQTGTYTVQVSPGANAATFNLLLSSDATGTLTANGAAQTFNPTRAGQAVSYTFSGTAAQNLSVAISSDTFPGNSLVKVYAPDGSMPYNSTAYYSSGAGASGTLTMPNLPATGTYTVRVEPAGGLGGIQVALKADASGTLAVDGNSSAISLASGQNARYTFTGSAGQYLGLGLTGLSTTPSGGSVSVVINKPDGSALASFTATGSSFGTALPVLPVSGTYTVVANPGASAANFNMLLSADASGSLQANGSALTFSPTRVGQAASYTFNASAGQSFKVIMSGDTFVGTIYYNVYAPNGALWSSMPMVYSSGAGSSNALALANLPSTGVYTVRVIPPYGVLGSASVALTSDATGTLPVDGGAMPVSLIAGQNGRYTFYGSSGTSLGLGVSNLSTTPSGKTLSITVNKPDGTALTSVTTLAAAGGVALPVLPVTGTYTVLVDPWLYAANFNLLLTTDASGTLVPNGATLNFNPAKVGQAATYTFSGTSGQTFNLSMTGDSFAGSTNVYVNKPDGTQWMSSSVYYSSGATTSGSLSLTNLPVSGTYTVRVIPPNGVLGSIALRLDAQIPLTLDAAAVPASLTTGNSGLFSFTGTAGQYLGIGITGISTTPSNGTLSVLIRSPDGGNLTSLMTTQTAGSLALPLLPTSGKYSILVSPGTNAANFNILVSTDASGTLTANGAAMNFSPTRMGQAASYTFSGTAGQTLNLSMAGDTFAGYTYIYVYKPDGTQLTNNYVYYSSGVAAAGNFMLPGLPVTGNYIVRVMPPNGVLGSISIGLNAPTALTADAAATPVALTTGRTGLFSFNGSAGQYLGLGVAGLATTPSGATVFVTINKPDGSNLTSFTSTTTAGGVALPVLPVTGTYMVLVSPGTNAANFNLMLSSDVSGTLIANGASQNFSPTRVGQAATYTFSANAGQTVNLSMAGDNFVGYTYAYVYKPDGTSLTSSTAYYSSGAATASNFTLTNLPVTGTYTVRVIPPNGMLGNISIGLNAQIALTVDAAATPVTLTAGRSGLFSFAGTSGQYLGLGVSGLSTAPSGGTLSVTIYRPDGTYWTGFTTTASAGGLALPVLPVSGTYSVVVSPGTYSASFNMLVSSDASDTLVANGTALNFNPSRVGQAARYSFSGSAGQTLNLSLAMDTFVGSGPVYVYKPDGTMLLGTSMSYGSGAPTAANLALANLPVTGTYFVRILPPNGVLGSLSVGLNAPIAVTADAAATAVTLTAGRAALYSFTGTAGQYLGLGMSGLSTTPSNGSLTVRIYKPDGSQLTAFTQSSSANGVAMPVLPVTGTYIVSIDPGTNAANFNLLLSTDITGALTANGAMQTFAQTRIGQAASYTFSGTAGQNVNLAFAGDSLVGYTSFYIYKPDGSQLTYTNLYYSSGAPTAMSLMLNNLPATGTYIIRVMPPNGGLGSVSVGLNAPIALTTDAAATPVSLTAGRTGLFSFSGNAGQYLGLGVSGLATTPSGGTLTVSINKPDGMPLTSFTTTPAAGGIALPALPVSGTYSVLVSPGTNSANFNVLVSTDANGTLAANGASIVFSPTRVGQAANYVFGGTAGQTVNVSLASDTFIGTISYYVYKPDGTLLSTGYVTYSSGVATADNLMLNNLPATGNYMVRIVPPNGVLGSVTIGLNAPIALAADAAATPVSLTAGRTGLFSFTGSAGQYLDLGIAGMSTAPSGGTLNVTINKPDGTSLGSFTTTATAGGYPLPVLPATGTYSVLVNPGTNAATFNILLSTEATGSLTVNGVAQTFSPTRMGQTVSYTFSGTAGQTMSLPITGDTFVGYSYIFVYKPDGTQWLSTGLGYSSGAGVSTTVSLSNLPATGTYKVRILPPNGVLGAINVGLTQ